MAETTYAMQAGVNESVNEGINDGVNARANNVTEVPYGMVADRMVLRAALILNELHSH